MATIVEDFEDTAFNIVMAGPWIRSDTAAQTGSWSLRSPLTTTNNTSYNADIAIPPSATTVTFHYRVSSESTYDLFNTLLDGVQVAAVSGKSGEIPWTPATLDVTGKTTLTFQYKKDPSDRDGSDCAWVDNLVFTMPVADTERPSVPTNLRATRTTPTRVALAWDASADNTGVTGYEVYRDGVLIATAAATTYNDPGRTPATNYAYRVAARDGSGNVSALSSPHTVTTNEPSNGPAEILIDPSSPPLASANSSTITTATFTPPGGSLLIALSGFSGGQPTAITNTGPTLEWTKHESAASDGTGAERGTATVAVAQIDASQPMTVTATSGTFGDSGGLLVLVVTGTHPDEAIGAVSRIKVSNEMSFTANLYTSTTEGSLAVATFYNWNIDSNSVDASAAGWPYSGNRGSGIAAYKTAVTEEEGTLVQMTYTAADVGLRGNIVAVEILPALLSGPATVIHGWGPLPVT
ncbi:hypothetical protein ABZ897_15860 [Nonomuraea sp. NPDC046802]|uniref:fibronectin type III domain-containing protein n=1 Tax=Nonomuraea sp. NPDC046802 TaxID=3154919 RepID=UPI0033EF0916